MEQTMGSDTDDAAFDRAFVGAVFARAGLVGWADVTLAEAARDAGLAMARVRRRFPSKAAVLLRFGTLADEAALAGATIEGGAREKLFDMLMNRFEVLQSHRGGVLALLTALRTDPATALFLYTATIGSMRWLLDAAGVPAQGLTGQLRVHGLTAIWLYALRAWERDESPDLSGTMAAIDRGLDRALQAERSRPGGGGPEDEASVAGS